MQVEDFFTHLLQRVVPKHDTQARAEVTVTRRFLENFSADQASPQHLSAQHTDVQAARGRCCCCTPAPIMYNGSHA